MDASETTLDSLRKEVAELRRRLNRVEAERKGDGAFLNMREVSALTSLSRREIYRRLKDKTFPVPVKLGEKRKAWPKARIQRWLRDQQAEQLAS